MDYRKPIRILCLATGSGSLNLECKADDKYAISNEYLDKEVYLNPAFIMTVTFDSIRVRDEKHNPTGSPFINDRFLNEEIFIICLHDGTKYKARKKYWEQFYKDWTVAVC